MYKRSLFGIGSALAVLMLFAVNTAQAQSVTATWEHQSASGGPVTQLGGGQNVNPSVAGSRVRLKISGIRPDCRVKSVEIFDENFIIPDYKIQDLGGTLSRGTFTSPWTTAPKDDSDAGSHSEVYALITLQCEDGDKVIKSGIINVAHGVVKQDDAVSANASTTEGGGAINAGVNAGVAGAEANVQTNQSFTSQRLKVVDYDETYVDPTVESSLEVVSGPSDWKRCLSVTPKTQMVGPGKKGEAHLIIKPSCSAGRGVVAVHSKVLETGYTDQTDPFSLEIEANKKVQAVRMIVKILLILLVLKLLLLFFKRLRKK